jgi:hypothetical protein
VDREYFLRRGFRIAILEESEKVPSVIQKLIKVVIGRRSGSIQDLRSLVGMRSREHVKFEKERMAVRTSSKVANEKLDR